MANAMKAAKMMNVVGAVNLAVRACEDEDAIEFMLNVIKSLKLQVFAKPHAARRTCIVTPLTCTAGVRQFNERNGESQSARIN